MMNSSVIFRTAVYIGLMSALFVLFHIVDSWLYFGIAYAMVMPTIIWHSRNQIVKIREYELDR